jgi:hypothetical protein
MDELVSGRAVQFRRTWYKVLFSQTRVYQRNIRTLFQFFYLIIELHATGFFPLADRQKLYKFLNYSKSQNLYTKVLNHVII